MKPDCCKGCVNEKGCEKKHHCGNCKEGQPCDMIIEGQCGEDEGYPEFNCAYKEVKK